MAMIMMMKPGNRKRERERERFFLCKIQISFHYYSHRSIMRLWLVVCRSVERWLGLLGCYAIMHKFVFAMISFRIQNYGICFGFFSGAHRPLTNRHWQKKTNKFHIFGFVYSKKIPFKGNRHKHHAHHINIK